MSAPRWGSLCFVRHLQQLLPCPSELGDPRATQECCQAPFALYYVCFSVVELRQRLSCCICVVSPYD